MQQSARLSLWEQTPIRVLCILVEVMHLPPFVVPNLQAGLLELLPEGEIDKVKAAELHAHTHLYDRFCCAEQRKTAVCAFSSAKLLASNDKAAGLALPDVYTRCHRPHENTAIFAIIYEGRVHVVQQKDVAILASFDVKLLAVDAAWFTHNALSRLLRDDEVLGIQLCSSGLLLC